MSDLKAHNKSSIYKSIIFVIHTLQYLARIRYYPQRLSFACVSI